MARDISYKIQKIIINLQGCRDVRNSDGVQSYMDKLAHDRFGSLNWSITTQTGATRAHTRVATTTKGQYYQEMKTGDALKLL